MQTGMIIVSYNDYDSLIHLIKNVKDYKIIKEIVIVDNNSNDEVKRKLKKIKYENVHLLLLDDNLGYSNAINEGSKYLINKFGKCNIIVSNADVVIDKEKDIKNLLKTLSKSDIGIVAPVIIEHGHLNRGWKNATPNQEIIQNIVYFGRKYRNKKILYKDSYYSDDVTSVDIVSGCFFIIKSECLKEIEYMDTNVFLYYEENILCKKIKNIGRNIVINNDVLIIHNHSISIDRSISKINKYKLLKKSQYYFNKNYNSANKIQLFLLKLTASITGIILKVSYLFMSRKCK